MTFVVVNFSRVSMTGECGLCQKTKKAQTLTPYISISRGLGKNGKISKREPIYMIYRLSETGLIWI